MKFIDPRSDIAFKKIFGNEKHPEVLLSFLNAVLNLASPIVTVKLINPYQAPRLVLLKETTLDVQATDAKGQRFIVEMQMETGDAFGKRSQCYAFKSYVDQLKTAEKYRLLKPVYFIGVLNFEMFEGDAFQSQHITINQNTGKQDLMGVEFNFIELPKFNKSLTNLDGIIDQWIYFLKNAESLKVVPQELAATSEIVSAFEIADQHGWSENELHIFEYWQMKEGEQLDIIETKERKSLEKGLKKGREEGRVEGREEGLNEKALEIARNLLDVLDDETIAKKTKLTVAEVANLRK